MLKKLKALAWPERISVLALCAAAASFLLFGGILSAICFLIVAVMGWTKPFLDNAARGKPTMGTGGRLAVGGIMGTLAVIMLPDGADTSPEGKEAAGAVKAAAQLCDFGSKKTERDYVAKSDVDLKSSPKSDGSTVPWKVGDETVAYPMEEGRTVREHCRVGKWSKVHIPTSNDMPRLYGWVPSSALRDVPVIADGRRRYTIGDFDWPQGRIADRAAAVTVMNRIMDERPECEALDTGSLVSNKVGGRQVFSIPCFAGKEMLSFDFRSADATNGRSFARIEPLEKFAAIDACKSAVLGNATHPSTVEFPTFDYDFRLGDEGRTQVLTSATAKNAFGLTLKFDVQCDFNGRMLDNFAMSEASGQ